MYRALTLLHEFQQMRGCHGTLQVQMEAKPFTNFLAERKRMQAADLTAALARGMRHDVSDRFEIHSGRVEPSGGPSPVELRQFFDPNPGFAGRRR